MRKMLAFMVALLLASPAFAQPVTVPGAVSVTGQPVTVLPVITVDTTGAYVAPGGSGPTAAQLPASLGAKTGALSLSVVPNTNTPFPVTDNGSSLTVDTPQLPAALGATTSAASLSVTPATNATFAVTPTTPIGGTYTDRSLASLTGSSQTLMASNANRRILLIYNIGATAVAINLTGGTASMTVGGSVVLVAGGTIILNSYPPTSAITIIGTLAASVTAYEG